MIRNALFLLLALPGMAMAAPLELTHQGRLLDATGAGIDAEALSLTFEIRDHTPSQNTLWTELLAPAVDNGYFTVVLGRNEANPLQAEWFAGDLSLRIVLADGEILADEPLRSVPTAISSYAVSGGPVDAAELRVEGVAVRVPSDRSCDADTRGGMRFVQGAPGTADQLEWCADDGSGALQWRALTSLADVATPGVDVNPPGSTLIPSSAFVDPNPPSGWTQCAGFVNTSANDVTDNALDNCLPVSRMRIRMWNASGVLVDDVFSESGTGQATSAWPTWNYVTSNRTAVVSTYWGSGAGFFATMDGRDACGQSTGGSTPHLGTGNGSVAAIFPGHSNHAFELGRNCGGNAYVDFTVAVYQ